MTKNILLNSLSSIKEEFHKKYRIISLDLYGSYARNEATGNSDVHIFCEKDKNFQLSSGLEFMNLDEK